MFQKKIKQNDKWCIDFLVHCDCCERLIRLAVLFYFNHCIYILKWYFYLLIHLCSFILKLQSCFATVLNSFSFLLFKMKCFYKKTWYKWYP